MSTAQYILEVTPGTTPATPAGSALVFTDFDPGIKIPVIESRKIRSDRQTDPGSIGVPEANPSGSGEVSFGVLDDILACVFGADWATNVLKIGTNYTPKTKTLEWPDVGTSVTKFQAFKGLSWSKLTIAGGLGKTTTFSVDGVAMEAPATTVATLFSSSGTPNTNPVYGPNTSEGSLSFAGSVLDSVIDWSFTFDNSTVVNRACWRSVAHSIRQKNMKITGSVTIYHADGTNYDRLRAGTEFAVQLVLGNGTTKTLKGDGARARVIDVSCPDADDTRKETVSLACYAPTSGADTAWKWTRIA